MLLMEEKFQENWEILIKTSFFGTPMLIRGIEYDQLMLTEQLSNLYIVVSLGEDPTFMD